MSLPQVQQLHDLWNYRTPLPSAILRNIESHIYICICKHDIAYMIIDNNDIAI